MSHPFDLFCKHHADRPIDDRFRPDHLCAECGIEAQNAGARRADAEWHKTPERPYQQERSTDDRSIFKDAMGGYRTGQHGKDSAT